MAKVPGPKQGRGCISIGGLVVCPHTVYLTAQQKKIIYKMHRDNASRMQQLEDATKGTSSKKKRKSKRRLKK